MFDRISLRGTTAPHVDAGSNAPSNEAVRWRASLSAAPVLLALPGDRPRAARRSPGCAALALGVEAELSRQLHALAQRHAADLGTVLLAAWGVLLARLAGQGEVVIAVQAGPLEHPLALHLAVDDGPDTARLLGRASEALGQASQHSHLPLEQLAQDLGIERSAAYPPLAQVLFAWNAAAPEPSAFELALELADTQGTVSGHLHYATALFDESSAQRFAGYLCQLLAGMVAQPERSVLALNLLGEAEHQRLVHTWNATQRPFDNDRCVHQLFEAQAAANPEAVAVRYAGEALSYGQLNAQANRLAHHLRGLGVGPDARVGVCLERSLAMPVSVLAVLKAGAAYVPLDPTYPRARLAHMLVDSAPPVVLTHGPAQAALSAALEDLPRQPALLDLGQPEAWAAQPACDPDPSALGLTPRHLAYVIYTSGSTGTPKGVMVEHRGLLAVSAAWETLYRLGGPLNHLQMAGFSFDVFSADLIRALGFGGTLVLCPQAALLDPPSLYRLLQEQRIGFADFVPAVLDPLLAWLEETGQHLTFLRTLVCGSDIWSGQSARRLRLRCGDSVQLVQAYGVTEASIDSTCYELGSADAIDNVLPIGRPLANTRLYLLDPLGAPVPTGVAGELHLGGAGVARGYLNLPALTAERFIDSPFVAGERLYRSGDLARYRPDGNLEFLGRNDFQAKLRGLRLELGDIEAQLAAVPGVAQSLVLLRQDAPGEPRLVAYYRPRDGAALTPGELREHLAAQLPGYMVPSAFVCLAALPVTANGKLDRTALPAPSAEAFGQRHYQAPQGPLETALAKIWAEVLGAERVGREDHFFDLGGHSLLVMRVLAQVRQGLHLHVAPSALFAAPTLAGFAHVLEGSQGRPRAGIVTAERHGPQPLSSAQQRLWFLAQMKGGNAAYHMPLNLRVRGPLQPAALEHAFTQLVARHDALRTTFSAVEGEGRQHVAPPGQAFTLALLDLQGHADAEARLAALIDEESHAPFDLEHGPLLRARLARLGHDHHVLLLTQHHIVSDGWSVGVLTRELGELYAAACQGRDAALPPLPVRYVDYAAWQRQWLAGDELARQVGFWQRTLSGAPVLLELPTDHKRPPVQTYQGGFVPLVFDTTLTARLKALSREQGVTLFMTLLAGWALVLARLSGQADVVIGVPSANRAQPELEGLLGFFVNTLALRMTVTGAPTVADWLGQARQVALHAQEHQDLPFEQVVEALNPPRSLAHSPLFQVLFAWEQDQGPDLALAGLEVSPVTGNHRVAKFDLQLALSEREGQIVGGLEYASSLFERASVEGFGEYLRRVLGQMAEQAEQPLAALDLLSVEQRYQVVEGFNQSARDHGPLPGFVTRFEAMARRAPEALALVAGSERWTYAQLNQAANRLAHHLISLGVGPEQRVGVSLSRSPAMVLGVLAILKAGAAYVPFDPAYPRERLAFMFADAAPRVLLTQASLRDELPLNEGVQVRCLDSDTPAWAQAASTDPQVAVSPDHLAYVLYTSGSTGRPKGVAHSRAALDNLIAWQLEQPAYQGQAPRRALQFASLNFDVSFQEIFSTLCSGGSLLLLNENSRKDLASLRATLVAEGVQRAFLPFAVLQQLAGFSEPQAQAPAPAGGCEIVTAGEALQVNDELRAFVRGLGGSQLHNQYGPTETHVVSQFSLACATAGQWPEAPPIGRPIDNARLYVLDASMNPVPVGVTGELYIAGACLARGYLNRPGLTAERFLPDPFSTAPGARLYRSGDLARFRADGNIEYLGRSDQQVKLRGFRVELGEIDSLLHQQPGVREAAVLLREDAPGDPRLVAYVAGEAREGALRAALKRHLPEHMLPGAWVFLAHLPLTGNGKLDRRALPAPERAAGAAYVAPVDERERQMAHVWAEVLKRERVGRDDHFFELGGHSLLATRMIYALNQRLGGQLSLGDLFEAPRLQDLAARLGETAGKGDAEPAFELVPDRAARHEPFPLTDIQQAYWFGREATVGLGGVSAHGYEELRIPDFDLARFEQALNRMIQRHGMLRVVFRSDGTQQVLAQVPTYRMPVHDLRGLPAGLARQSLEATRERQSHQVLDASRWPLFEFAVSQLDDGISHLHISLDALIVDAASTQILTRELMAFYADPNLALPEPELTFRDYVLAEQQLRQGHGYERALRFWRERAAELAPAPELPLARQPQALGNPHFTRRDRVLGVAQWDQLKAVAKDFAITPSVLLLTAFSQVLALWSRQPRFTLSLPLFNRLPLHPDVDAIIGDFTSVVLLEVAIDGAASFHHNARAVQARLWQAIDHSQVSGVRVLRELSQARGVQQTAMPIVFNSTLSEAAPELAEFNLAHALNASHEHSITQTPQVWLDHTLLELDGCLLFNWDSIDDLFPAGLMDAMFDAYNSLLDRLAEPASWAASTADLLPLARLPAPVNSPADWPLLHELFERQAHASPNALALVDHERQLSYSQLRSEARQLGARLQTLGLEPGQLVAVTMARGWQQLVATLGILYAGGAYLPLDPSLPAERKRHICERAGVALALTQPALLDSLEWPAQLRVLAVTAWAGGEPLPLRPVAVAPEALAYVIYTSGSTGQPKGVAIDHRGAVNTLLDINRRLRVGPADRVLAISSLSFDLSVYDFFGTLAAGAAVVILEPQQALDPAHWQALVERHGVSLWNSVPALFGMWLEYLEGEGRVMPPSLRLAMLSGDWIPLNLPERAWALQPEVQLISLGGATEASIWSICYPIQQVDPGWRSIPYGRALDRQRFYVLDDALQVRPAWVPGQLYIGGIGLAQGYWRDEALSAASFFPHPVTGERLYRTGDLGRLLPDGNIEFLGREDNQVKVQGYRIELGEIEAVLNRHPGVDSAVVRVLGAALEEKRLAGYVLKADAQLQASDIGHYLADKLPPYMVPGSFTFVDAWPLSANGKVDKKRLPEPVTPAAEAMGAGDAVEVQGPEEAQLVAIVQTVLKREPIAGDANLLSLGATSIDIVRISNALSSALGFRPHVAQLLAQPTLRNLLGLYRARPVGLAAPVAAPADAVAVIEDPQQRAQFKAEQRGRRAFPSAAAQVALELPSSPAFARRYSDYRSVRQYSAQPMDTQALAQLLAALAQGRLEGQVKYQFASAGGLYPIQAYLSVKPGRVRGVAAGAYYYDPCQHRLLAVGQGSLSADAYDYFVNRPLYDGAAFALFLIADMAAIRPLYGERSRDFCHIEAGAMAQLLTMSAAEHGLGLCGVGTLEDQALTALFDLGPGHQLIYSMVGGLRDAGEVREVPLEAFTAAPADDPDMEEIEL
ncbi:non-ribosomal peptide synthetase [Pseudomonas sp. RIT-PI-S]|uniref:non-ribosomal peptide synthetase n=1 Tax=Pseudomonas sp. RIT-PI-S TaxID=3035295 RepID=UPI0021D80F3A|nr:non-ribosomal peptide synthetase [Pseudomonas sp. RIT-PI-S]